MLSPMRFVAMALVLLAIACGDDPPPAGAPEADASTYANTCFMESEHDIDPSAQLAATPEEAISETKAFVITKAADSANDRTASDNGGLRARGQAALATAYESVIEEPRSDSAERRYWVDRNEAGEITAEITVEHLDTGWVVTHERWSGPDICGRLPGSG